MDKFKYFTDKNFMALDDFEKFLDQNFYKELEYEGKKSAQKGASSFCVPVEFDGKTYAWLTPRAGKMAFQKLHNISKIINPLPSPVPIVGAAVEKDSGKYGILMPFVKGVNLPSNYGVSREENIIRIVKSKDIPDETFYTLIKDSVVINKNLVHIDAHGNNFRVEEGTGNIRMFDLNNTSGAYPLEVLASKYYRMFSYDRAYPQLTAEVVAEEKEKGIDIHRISVDILKKYDKALYDTEVLGVNEQNNAFLEAYSKNGGSEAVAKKVLEELEAERE